MKLQSLDWPGWVWRCRIGRTRVRVYPSGLLVLCIFQLVVGLMLLWMMPVWVAVITREPITIALLDSMHVDVGGALVFVPFAVLSTVVHELGHVAGARLAGFPAKSYVLGSFGRVYSETPTTPRGLLLLTAGGPLVGLVYGLVLVSLAPTTAPVGAAGVWAITAGVTNLVPWPTNSDGSKIWRAVRDLAHRPSLAKRLY